MQKAIPEGSTPLPYSVDLCRALTRLITEIDSQLITWWSAIQNSSASFQSVDEHVDKEREKYPFEIKKVRQEWEAIERQWSDCLKIVRHSEN
jgi:hypothetical protein